MKSTSRILKAITKKYSNNSEAIKTGFPKFDKFTNGLQRGQLIIMAGRPGMGNLAFTRCLVLNTSIRHQNPVAIFSLEQSCETYLQKMIATEAGISYVAIKRGNHSEEIAQILDQTLAKMEEASIFINDDLSFALNALIFKIAEVRRKHNIKLLVIHGCDLLTDNEHNKLSKQQAQNLIASKMKQLAVDENIAIIITHELSEIMQPYNNEEVLPSLKEVYEDTPIAKYADLVTFLYRPEYYGFKTWYHTNESSEAQADLVIVKNRHGNLNNFRLSFDGYSSQFTEVDDIFFENTTTVS